MFDRLHGRLTLVRGLVAAGALLLVPALLSLSALRDTGTVEVGEPAPRTVIAEDEITVVDQEATQAARDRAAAQVEVRTAQDTDAFAQIVDDARSIFSAAENARVPEQPDERGQGAGSDPDPVVPSTAEQRNAIMQALPDLPETLVDGLVGLTNEQLTAIRAETVELAQDFALLDVTEETLGADVDAFLARNLPLLDLDDLELSVVRQTIEQVVRPTILVDTAATQLAREEAAAAVAPIGESWAAGDAIVEEGEVVTELDVQALQEVGLEGSTAPFRYLRALGAMLVVVAVLGVYLWRMQPKVWANPRKLLLLGAVIVGYAGLVAGVSLMTELGQVAWWYLVPVGALAMLVALLVQPVVAIASMLPAVVMVTLAAPLSNGVAVFTAAAVLTSVPLTVGIASRGDLRSATLRAGVAMPVIAALAVGVFGPHAELLHAVGAAALNGLLVTLLVQGLLPLLENMFRLPTVTALLDLADRNHPLMRELETKAIGSYNHSVMVASLTERACREIGADPLLGSVAALYHDIGKIRRPHFFIENQYGITNPHDDLEPAVSALIIQEHVVDGVQLANEYKLPPEVVAAIASHHGTMLVSYFYNKAVAAAGGDASQVDEDTFRYKGTKPKGKEAAVLLIADCSEAATRSMAMSRGTLPRGVIESTVDSLVQARIDDGQFDECELTFDELRRVRDSVVMALEGIYHPRIAYPGGDRPSDDDNDSADDAVTGPQEPDSVFARDEGDDSVDDAPDHDASPAPVTDGSHASLDPGATAIKAVETAAHADGAVPSAHGEGPHGPHHGHDHDDTHIDWEGGRRHATRTGADHSAAREQALAELEDHEATLVTGLQDIDGVAIPDVQAQRP